MQELVREVRREMTVTKAKESGSKDGAVAGSGGGGEEEDLCLEVVATVLEIFGRMDSLVRLC